MWAALAIVGYWGNVFASKLPAITPEETFKLMGALGLTTGACPVPIMALIPPGVSLLRPSMPCTPIIDGGIAASFTCFIAFGILLGACNSVLSISDLV